VRVVPTRTDPPEFLQLAAHPVRWMLLQELVQSDRAVSELTQRLDLPQSLVSYHLRRLRAGEVVSARRSSADGRDSYYAIDLRRCAELLGEAGRALHPGLVETTAGATRPRTCRVLFLCTGNSARSQIAEALAQHLSGGRVQARSAGSNPKPLHAKAVRVMRRRGIDISSNRTKHLDEFVSRRFDHVITLCDRVREVCPEFPSHPNVAHWSIPDPAAGTGALAAFEATATELETRIRFFLARLDDPKIRRSRHAQR
jgi:ArsR family transcriptional regulator, arsenate/arsenite/antimonite-responsive transcriptional repressor / arsenate reductase (thioredoxin)